VPRRRVVGTVVADVAEIVGVAADDGRRRVATSSTARPPGGPSPRGRRDVGGREQLPERQAVADAAVAGVRRDVGQPPHRLPAVVDGALQPGDRVQLASRCRRVVRRKCLSTQNINIDVNIYGAVIKAQPFW